MAVNRIRWFRAAREAVPDWLPLLLPSLESVLPIGPMGFPGIICT